MSTDEVTTLVFDVMGTVVELNDSHRAWTQAVLSDWDLASHQIESLLEDVETAQTRLMDAVISGALPWQPHRELRRRAVEIAMETGELSAITGEVRDRLAAATGQLKPWPDSAAALSTLREHFTVVALSNADLSELTQLSAGGGLAWHAALSGAFAQAFKPQAAVYQKAIELLGIEPQQAMMVAAHPWDLRAAAEHGFATCFVNRPGSEQPTASDAFDLAVGDLRELAVWARAAKP